MAGKHTHISRRFIAGSKMKGVRKKHIILIASATILVSLVISVLHDDNFHAVTDGVIYRSKQIEPQSFVFYIDKYKIKSVLNLRGEQASSEWYQQEIAVMKQQGIAHFDYRLSAIREVDSETLDKILTIIDTAPKPILIHCLGGADRTGLVCAIWKYRHEGIKPDIAVKQLSSAYGHFPYFGNRTVAMDISYWKYVNDRKKGIK